jgi:hypothetical protein
VTEAGACCAPLVTGLCSQREAAPERGPAGSDIKEGRMRKVLVSLVVLAAALVVAPALADTVSLKSIKLNVDAPKGWVTEKDGDKVTLKDKKDHEEVAVLFMSVPDGSKEQAKKVAKEQLEKAIKDLKCEEEKDIETNGLKGKSIDCTGQADGKNVDISIVVLDTPAKDKDLFILAAADHAKVKAHKDELKSIFKSIKAAS